MMKYKKSPAKQVTKKQTKKVTRKHPDQIQGHVFRGPQDVPTVPYTQAQIDTMSQKTYSKLPMFFQTLDETKKADTVYSKRKNRDFVEPKKKSPAKQTEVYSRVTQKSDNNNVSYNAERVVRDQNSTAIQRANEDKVKTRLYRINDDGTGTLAVSGSNNPRGRKRTIKNPKKAQRKMDRVNKRADNIINEGNSPLQKKDACYHKVKSRYDVWPSAYASGALAKCRKVGAANWGNKSKK